MKKKRFVIFVASIFIIGGLLAGILYIPEKPCDSMTDLDEIADHIGACVGDYYDNRDTTNDGRWSGMMESIAVITVYPEKNEVEVGMVKSTFWKKQIFRREVINSKYVKFVNCESYMVND